jgi:hypothetical protein
LKLAWTRARSSEEASSEVVWAAAKLAMLRRAEAKNSILMDVERATV